MVPRVHREAALIKQMTPIKLADKRKDILSIDNEIEVDLEKPNMFDLNKSDLTTTQNVNTQNQSTLNNLSVTVIPTIGKLPEVSDIVDYAEQLQLNSDLNMQITN